VKRIGSVLVPVSEELTRELGIYGIVWPVAQDKAAQLGGRLTGEHWVHREQVYHPATGEFIGVVVRYVWKMVEL
jgi:hypothetical protein